MRAAVHQRTNDTEFCLELSAKEVREVALCDLTSLTLPDISGGVEEIVAGEMTQTRQLTSPVTYGVVNVVCVLSTSFPHFTGTNPTQSRESTDMATRITLVILSKKTSRIRSRTFKGLVSVSSRLLGVSVSMGAGTGGAGWASAHPGKNQGGHGPPWKF